MQHTAKKCGSLRVVLNIDFCNHDSLVQTLHDIIKETTQLDSSAQCSIDFIVKFAGDLPPVTNSTDARILKWVIKDPDLTDKQIGQRLGV
ncbi:MAG: hypothetical protein U9R15_16440, partial [Chloroflexota bacterium]|nr:hypothetical protein [Chloroflexota bacterium]